MWIGDFRLGDTFDVKFCTVQSTGAPTTLAGTPVVSAYPGNSVTELTAGITLTADFDSRTGLNNVRVVATSGNGYATATNYALVITTGTVNSVSAVGYVIGHFSIEARSQLMPTVAARTLDVSATGEAGVDWANVGTPGSTVSLSATTVATTTTATATTTVNGLAANVITAASINAAALNGKGDWNIGKTGYALSAAGVQAIWDALTSALTTAGSIGKLIVDNLNATITSRHASGAAVASVTGAVGSVAAGGITAASFGAGAIDAAALNADAAVEVADTLLDRNMATGTDSGSPTVRTVRQALRMLRNKGSISAGTLTVTKEDDTTASWTAAVTTTAGDPISSIDPASA